MRFSTTWSPDDQQFVGLCDEYPSLSWLAGMEQEALVGIEQLVEGLEEM